MWVEFVDVSRLPQRVFLQDSGFPTSTKTNIPNFNSNRIEDPNENQLRLMWLISSLNIVIYIFELVSWS